MSLNIVSSSFTNIGKDKFCRANFKTAILKKQIDSICFSNVIRLKEIFSIVSGFAFKSEDYVSKGIPLVRIGDLNGYSLENDNMVFLPDEFYEDPKFSSYKIKKNDLLVSLTGDGNLKCIRVQDDICRLLNQRVAILRQKKKVNVDFYYWILNSEYVKKQFRFYSNGKSQLNISPFDLMNIFVPIISEEKQLIFLNEISPIENRIKSNLALLKPSKLIINNVFQKKFKYDYDSFSSSKKNLFISDFSQYGNNVDVRFSSKFHRPAAQFVYKELLKRPNKKIKKCLKIPMITGQGIETNNYDEAGEYAYISMADIKSWKLDTANLKNVSNSYVQKKRKKKIKGVKKEVSCEIEINDIVMMRSGEGGIGKVAIIKDDLKGIFCDFLIRMRFDENLIDPDFAYYYFRSEYFQYLIETNKKGLGNNTNIFPNQVQEMPLPDIDISEQKEIVKVIGEELKKQKALELLIYENENDIEKKLNKTLKD